MYDLNLGVTIDAFFQLLSLVNSIPIGVASNAAAIATVTLDKQTT